MEITDTLNQLVDARMTKGTHRCDQPARRIGYSIKITDMKRLGLAPTCGVLDPMENGTSNDCITIEETNTPDGTVAQFRGEWFQGDGMVRRKNLPIEYNT
uniref:MSP domain-containing protein n=2 Tax=Caenorhabditis japonica TaxID=281687 RepID=A0A8R1IC42_CAEJA